MRCGAPGWARVALRVSPIGGRHGGSGRSAPRQPFQFVYIGVTSAVYGRSLMQRSLRRALTGAVFVLLASCGGGSPEPATQLPQASGSGRTETKLSASDRARAGEVYIVRLAEPAVAAYDGTIRGHAATRPAKGSKLDSSHPDVASYRAHLAARQDAVMRSAGVSKALRGYGYVFNGFAARMSESQAMKLAGTTGVLSVVKDEKHTVDTSSTPT